jgi:hypothetical protein
MLEVNSNNQPHSICVHKRKLKKKNVTISIFGNEKRKREQKRINYRTYFLYFCKGKHVFARFIYPFLKSWFLIRKQQQIKAFIHCIKSLKPFASKIQTYTYKSSEKKNVKKKLIGLKIKFR